MNRLKSIMLLLAALGMGMLGSGLTAMVSAHGGDTTRIHACLNAGNGTIYVVDAHQTRLGLRFHRSESPFATAAASRHRPWSTRQGGRPLDQWTPFRFNRQTEDCP